MLWTNPTDVRLGSRALEGVRSVMLKERATETVIEHESVGPSPTFIDVVAVAAEFVLEREVLDQTSATVRVGERGSLRFVIRRESADAKRAVVSAQVVVTAVNYTIDAEQFVEKISAAAYAASASLPVLTHTREGATA